MAESVIVRQNSQFETEILALDPHDPTDQRLHPVEGIHQLTPYGMLLAGLASCTAIVLHTYARHHGLDLQEVVLRAQYDRVFVEDCEQCETIEEYRERIEEEITLIGELTARQRERLYMVSRHCPIHKMLSQGIEISSRLADHGQAKE